MNPELKPRPVRTDTRPLAVRKASLQLRIADLRAQLAACERADAELDVEIEQAERAAECLVREIARGYYRAAQ